MLISIKSRSPKNLVTSGQKLGHKVKSEKKTMCTLQRAQFKCNLHETLSEYLSQLNLGWDQNWVMRDQKVGHKANY